MNKNQGNNCTNGEKRLRALFDLNIAIMEVINSDLSLNSALDMVLKEIGKKIPYSHGAIFLPDEKGNLEMIASEGYPEKLRGKKFGKGIIKYVYDSGSPVYEPNFKNTSWDLKPYKPELVEFYPEMNSVLVIPLGKYGVFELFSDKKDAFSADAIDSLMLN
ncbi:MAG: GAF domain-containing protein, partial [Candidatus Pacearchaeota archaeon]|nr:GAF domain-containing protein [Candidatus Pacearchaeota archaeon]